MPTKIAICDDVQTEIDSLSEALVAYNPSFEIATFTSGTALIDEIRDGYCADILFLDIYMPGVSGIETARELRQRCRDMKIIFLSSSNEYYPQAFEVFAFNYVLKPIDRGRLYSVLERALEELHKETGYKICVKYKWSTHNIDCDDILYVESQNKLLFFHLTDGKTVKCYGTLDKLIQNLPEQFFIRCHQSFLVNARHITEMGENYFRQRDVLIAISKKYLRSAKDRYYAYLFSRIGGGQDV